jgi:hypothetical protein
VLRNILVVLIGLGFLPLASAQPSSKPQVKVNVLNVCSPSPEEQKEIAAALAKIPRQPLFSQDFEIARGRSTLDQAPDFLQPAAAKPSSSAPPTADWVRVRREFAVQALFSTVQYSFSVDSQNMVETLVLRVRDPKDLLQVSLEDSASAVTSPATMLATNTPASRVKLERFGKSSVVLARCLGTGEGPAPDQSAYEPLFRSASAILADYRGLLHARSTIPDELARVAGTPGKKSPVPAARKKKD